jgi:polyketide cyclase/dehydrase/lipid transport protein
MMQTSAAIVIHRPIDEVFRFGADPANMHVWVPGARIRLLSPGPFGNGTRFEETLMRFGRAIISIVEVRNYQVNEGFDFQTLTAPFPVRSAIGSLRFAATADGTRVSLSHRVLIVPWLRPLEPLLRWVTQAQSQRAVQAMKTTIEG